MGTGTMHYCSDCGRQFYEYELTEQPDGTCICDDCERERDMREAAQETTGGARCGRERNCVLT